MFHMLQGSLNSWSLSQKALPCALPSCSRNISAYSGVGLLKGEGQGGAYGSRANLISIGNGGCKRRAGVGGQASCETVDVV